MDVWLLTWLISTIVLGEVGFLFGATRTSRLNYKEEWLPLKLAFMLGGFLVSGLVIGIANIFRDSITKKGIIITIEVVICLVVFFIGNYYIGRAINRKANRRQR